MNASGGEVSASSSQFRRVVLPSARLLTLLLTVAVHPFKKPFIHVGFVNLTIDGHGLTRIFAIYDMRFTVGEGEGGNGFRFSEFGKQIPLNAKVQRTRSGAKVRAARA